MWSVLIRPHTAEATDFTSRRPLSGSPLDLLCHPFLRFIAAATFIKSPWGTTEGAAKKRWVKKFIFWLPRNREREQQKKTPKKVKPYLQMSFAFLPFFFNDPDPDSGSGGLTERVKKRGERGGRKDSLWPAFNGLKIACHECYLPGLSTAIEPSHWRR